MKRTWQHTIRRVWHQYRETEAFMSSMMSKWPRGHQWRNGICATCGAFTRTIAAEHECPGHPLGPPEPALGPPELVTAFGELEERHAELLSDLEAFEKALRERGKMDVEDTTSEHADTLAAIIRRHQEP